MNKKIIALIAAAGVTTAAFFICRHHEPQKESPLVLNEYQREAYLNLRGWDAEEISQSTVTVPESFEGVYKQYADVQKKQGLPLEEYKGKEVVRCLYNIKNYGGDVPVTAELLFYEDRLIAAALIENKPDGFIKSPLTF
ncbi:DUF4830 domain-containing protein [Porcipelethomonas sp.]|uniref:DUF4830 domain-containing protein n=1 Tax=Porcipelethomonas sp. TaxID=2981675 RepID=UPI003EF7259F